MDRDVESKVERLCRKYEVSAAKLTLVRPNILPSNKQRARLEASVATEIAKLHRSRESDIGAVVKLAYVRGLRSVKPKARLSDQHQIEIQAMETQLDTELTKAEKSAMGEFHTHIRRLTTANTLQRMGAMPQAIHYASGNAQRPFPLEERARASVTSIVNVAMAVGTLAGTDAGSYDAVNHGSRN